MLNPRGIARGLEAVAAWSGHLVPWLILPLAVLAFSIVVLRYGFDFGRIALQETVVYLHAFVLMMCMGYTLRENEHVRVDIFYRKMSRKKRALVDLAGAVLLLIPTCLTILVTSWSYVVQSWSLLESSPEAGGLPLVFVLKTLIPLMAVMLLTQGAADIIRNFTVIRDRTTGND